MTTSPMPIGFVSHGAPTLALDATHGKDLTRWAAAMPRPRAVLVVSAHWLDAPATLGTRTPRELLYDFSGFPEELYRVRYGAPAAGALAAELERRVPSLQRRDLRPWDHGVWVPLLHMYPAADVPVLQLSLPYAWSPRQLFDLGRELAPFRSEGVLLLASGGAVHNLGRLEWGGDAPPPAWATSFEGWLRERLAGNAFDDIVAFRENAPDLQLAHPTHDHFLPLLVALGAAAEQPGGIAFPISGFEFGSLSRLAVQFG
ncbi:MAG TPA: class III extradiol ring-cleavage dioxygenase [Planctomycetota bacterium]